MKRIFWRYFWTVQLIVGLASAGRMFAERIRYDAWDAIVSALFGFVVVIPLAALAAWIKAAIESRRLRRLGLPAE